MKLHLFSRAIFSVLLFSSLSYGAIYSDSPIEPTFIKLTQNNEGTIVFFQECKVGLPDQCSPFRAEQGYNKARLIEELGRVSEEIVYLQQHPAKAVALMSAKAGVIAAGGICVWTFCSTLPFAGFVGAVTAVLGVGYNAARVGTLKDEETKMLNYTGVDFINGQDTRVHASMYEIKSILSTFLERVEQPKNRFTRQFELYRR